MSVTIQSYYKGFSVLITKRDPEVQVSPLIVQSMETINKLLELGFSPSWNQQSNKEWKESETPLKSNPTPSQAYPTQAAPSPTITNGAVPCPECGAQAIDRQGVKAGTGKPWRGIFCQADKSHVKWLKAFKPQVTEDDIPEHWRA